jgi:hypothetical protein
MICPPVVSVAAVVKGGAALAGELLPDFVQLSELERHMSLDTRCEVVETVVPGCITAGSSRIPYVVGVVWLPRSDSFQGLGTGE